MNVTPGCLEWGNKLLSYWEECYLPHLKLKMAKEMKELDLSMSESMKEMIEVHEWVRKQLLSGSFVCIDRKYFENDK